MTVTLICPSCGTSGHVPDSYIGHHVRCKVCRHKVRVDAGHGPPQKAPHDLLPVRLEQYRCPRCGGVVTCEQPPPGQAVACPQCGAAFDPAAPPAPPERLPVPAPPVAVPAIQQPVACPHCQSHISFDPQFAGQEMLCPSCHGRFLMPPASLPVAAPVQRVTRVRRLRRRRRREYDDEPEGRGGSDAPGVIGLIFGVFAVVCFLMGFFTCGVTYWLAIPFGVVGLGVSFAGRSNMKVAGIVLNLIALLPAAAMAVIAILALAAATK